MDDRSYSIQINDETYHAVQGQSILDVAELHDCYIPHICKHPNLLPIQTCDTCMVEVDGQLVRACATASEPGMRVNAIGSHVPHFTKS